MARDGSLVEPRRRLTSEDRRAEILRAARTVFAQHGFDGASTAVIAAKAGCSEPTLYKHFASKQALFAAVLADAGLAMKAMVADTLAELRTEIEAIVSRYCEPADVGPTIMRFERGAHRAIVTIEPATIRAIANLEE